jgi:hypothetical protein
MSLTAGYSSEFRALELGSALTSASPRRFIALHCNGAALLADDPFDHSD